MHEVHQEIFSKSYNKRHKKYANLYFLQTDKDSPFMYSVTQECAHGLVLCDNDNSWSFVASPFSKVKTCFFAEL